MIVGVGTDIAKISRFASIRNKDSFLEKVFTAEEIEYIIEKKRESLQTIAGMFAAKEAVFKALNGLGLKIGWKDIKILHNEDGCPFVVLDNDRCKDMHFGLSMSHDGDYAVAVVVVES